MTMPDLLDLHVALRRVRDGQGQPLALFGIDRDPEPRLRVGPAAAPHQAQALRWGELLDRYREGLCALLRQLQADVQRLSDRPWDEAVPELLELGFAPDALRQVRVGEPAGGQRYQLLGQWLGQELARLEARARSGVSPPREARLVPAAPEPDEVRRVERLLGDYARQHASPAALERTGPLAWLAQALQRVAGVYLAEKLGQRGLANAPCAVQVRVFPRTGTLPEEAAESWDHVVRLPVLGARLVLEVRLRNVPAEARRSGWWRGERLNLPAVRAVEAAFQAPHFDHALGCPLVRLVIEGLKPDQLGAWLRSGNAGQGVRVLDACWPDLSDPHRAEAERFVGEVAAAVAGDCATAAALLSLARRSNSNKLQATVVAACLDGFEEAVGAGSPGRIDPWLRWFEPALGWLGVFARLCGEAARPGDWLGVLQHALAAVAKPTWLAVLPAGEGRPAVAVGGLGQELQTWSRAGGRWQHAGKAPPLPGQGWLLEHDPGRLVLRPVSAGAGPGWAYDGRWRCCAPDALRDSLARGLFRSWQARKVPWSREDLLGLVALFRPRTADPLGRLLHEVPTLAGAACFAQALWGALAGSPDDLLRCYHQVTRPPPPATLSEWELDAWIGFLKTFC
jgi:hypothetical protein